MTCGTPAGFRGPSLVWISRRECSELEPEYQIDPFDVALQSQLSGRANRMAHSPSPHAPMVGRSTAAALLCVLAGSAGSCTYVLVSTKNIQPARTEFNIQLTIFFVEYYLG